MMRTASLPLFFFFFLVISPLGQPDQDTSWLKIGAYARYTNTEVPSGRIILPNDTKLWYVSLDSPSILRWEIIKIMDHIVWLNLTLSIQGYAKIIDSKTSSPIRVKYHKSLLINIDVQTREATVDGEPIGKTSFWTETNVVIGQKIMIASSPSDSVEGYVTNIKSINLIGRKISSYEVEVLQFNPFVYAHYIFDQETGIALKYTLLGPVEILPGTTHTYTHPNGTTYNITSYAKTKLSEKLGLEDTYVLTLDETNIDFGEKLQITNTMIYFVAFISLFISLATAFILIDRRRRRHTPYRSIRKRVKNVQHPKDIYHKRRQHVAPSHERIRTRISLVDLCFVS